MSWHSLQEEIEEEGVRRVSRPEKARDEGDAPRTSQKQTSGSLLLPAETISVRCTGFHWSLVICEPVACGVLSVYEFRRSN